VGRAACTEPQGLYKGALYLYFTHLPITATYPQFDSEDGGNNDDIHLQDHMQSQPRKLQREKHVFTFFTKHTLQCVTTTAQLTSGQQFTHRCFHECLVFVGAFTKLRTATTASSCMSVRPAARNISAPIGCIFIKFHIGNFIKICPKKFNLGYKIK